MTTEEPTQLDRIEAKLDRLLAPPKLKIDLGRHMGEEQERKFAEAFKREFTEADRKRNQRLFLMPEQPEDKPKRSGLKLAAAIAGSVVVASTVMALLVCLWALVAQTIA